MKLYHAETWNANHSGTTHAAAEPAWFKRVFFTGRDESRYPYEVWIFRWPGLRWMENLYRRQQGWHQQFFCINLRTGECRWLYDWAPWQ